MSAPHAKLVKDSNKATSAEDQAAQLPAGWSIVACPLCESREHAVVFSASCELFNTSAEVTLRRCSCGLQLTNPQPRGETLAAFYATEAYYTHSPQRDVRGKLRQALRRWQLRGPLSVLRRVAERRLGWSRYARRLALDVFPLHRGLRLLDFGCGNGDFLAIARDLGLDATGVEPDEQARLVARRSGAVVHAALDTLAVESQDSRPFDRITLKHVLEHLPEPVETVSRLAEQLAADGRMLIAVPNADARQAEVFRQHWIGYDMPRHLWHFNAATLTALTQRAGLRVVRLISNELAWFAEESNAARRRAGLPGLSYRPGKLRVLEESHRGAELVVVAERAH